MHEEMRSLLNAFLDDELHGTRLLELKLHLTTCQACREELEDLRHVSSLLQAAPAPEFMSADRFVSNLALHLPRRTLQSRPATAHSLTWWLVPAGLLGAWLFLRTVFMLTSAITAADLTGLLGSASSWLGGGQQALWFSTLANLTGGQMGAVQASLSTLNSVSVVGETLLNGFIWQAVISLLYTGWLAAWLFRNAPQFGKEAAVTSRS